MTFPFSRPFFGLFLVCLFCFALSLLIGCGSGGGGLFTESVPTLTPAEQAEVDKYIANSGRDSLIRYLSDESRKDTDEKLVLKYVKYFVAQGADVNAKDSDHWNNDMTPLEFAVRRGDVEMVKFLVSKGADIDDSLRSAASAGHLEVVKFLVSTGANVDDPKPLNSAASAGHLEVVKYLVSKSDHFSGAFALHEAIRGDHLDVIDFLVSKGVDVNAEVRGGFRNYTGSALHIAADVGNLKIAEYLVSKGANVNSRNMWGDFPLHFASDNHLEVVKFLISKGADVDVKNRDGQTALDIARKKENADIVKYLSDLK